ncbi:PH domain-containing protein [Agromyces protaetiae]|uniref:PH domain-containing protein n=1 Tax=Agromyces protaetiae TaxID=2509455 RepID=A0A4P6FEC9_9MICO|nr:PH domain-containing protein [Agromyces protaetiae]QAY74600.1 PH domain-containing protein [Agromyces protaetiae]
MSRASKRSGASARASSPREPAPALALQSAPAPVSAPTPAPLGAPVAPATPERVVARLRRSARVLFFPAVLFIAVVGVAVYAFGVFPDDWQRIAIIAAAGLVVVLGCLLPFLAWLTRRTTITTRRIIMRSGVFVRTRQELLLSRGYDVTVRQTPGQRVFGSGSVRINTGHERPLVLRDLPRPALVQSALHELMISSNTITADRRRAQQSAPLDGDTVVWGRH